MKKFISFATILCLLFTMAIATSASELDETWTINRDILTWGDEDITPFDYIYWVKETNEVGSMEFAGTDNYWNQSMLMYQAPSTDYAYCFAGIDCLHPANNAYSGVSFTAPYSGTLNLSFVYYGLTSTELIVCINSLDNTVKRYVPNNTDTDFDLPVEVKEGDVVYFLLDCLENNAADQTPFWVKEFKYTAINSGSDTPATDAPATDAPATDAPATDAPAPDTSDMLFIGSAVLVLAAGASIVALKKRK